MRKFLRLAIVVALVLLGLPHVFCACGCAAAKEEVSASGKSCCGHDNDQPAEKDSKPCECQSCLKVDAVLPGPEVSDAPGQRCFGAEPGSAGPCVRTAECRMAGALGGAGPPVDLPPPSCGLPVLLGRLLL
jgi:hypothetical protein